jgi:alpha-amylase
MSTDINGVMMQYFEWYIAPDGNHYKKLSEEIEALAKVGITAIWLPPSYKGNGGASDVGYAVYDKYDLGEFEQKGSVRTKYGTKEELKEATQKAKAHGVQIYADIVFNHRIGGDEMEMLMAAPFDKHDRHHQLGPAQEIGVYTKFTFPGRDGKHSSFVWNKSHFDSVNYNALDPHKDMIWLFEGQSFEKVSSLEKGNYDFLLGCDLDMDNSEVQRELAEWGKWLMSELPIDGFRLDAVKHIPHWFYPFWLDKMNEAATKELFCVGEYWSCETSTLLEYIRLTEGKIKLFDVPLQNNFRTASIMGKNYDLRRIFDGSILCHMPTHSVTIVENHDTQPLQALENVVEPWFKPIAYALILLRKDGYPCVFYADYYGSEYEDFGRDGNKHKIVMHSHKWIIDKLLYARKEFAYGEQYDYFDHPNVVGWSRIGDDTHSGSMAVLISNGDNGYKWMYTGKPSTKYRDLLEHRAEIVETNEHGYGRFCCRGGSVSVWVEG